VKPRTSRTAECFTVAGLILLPALFFWRETLGRLTLGDQDAVFWFFPMYRLVAEQLRAGILPLWNPEMYSGTPLFAQWQPGVLDPLNWLYLAGATARMLTLVQELSFSLALVAAFVYARTIGLFRGAAIVTALIYSLSGFLVARTLYPGLLHTAALAPLVICLIERLSREQRWRDAASGALVVAWQIFAAHPQPFVYSTLLAILYTGFCLTRRAAGWRFLAQVGAMFVVGTTLASVQLLPAFQFAAESVRHDWSYEMFGLNSLHPMSLVGAIVPFLHGGGKGIFQVPYWGPYWHHNEASIYIGVAALALSGAGAWVAWRKELSIGKFWSLVAVAAVLLAFGKYAGPLGWLIYKLPLLGRFRSTNRHWMEVTLAIAVLAGLAIQRLLERDVEAKWAVRVMALALTLACGLIAAAAYASYSLVGFVMRVLPDFYGVKGILSASGAEFYLPLASASVACLSFWAIRRPRWLVMAVIAFLLLDYELYAAFAPINSQPHLEALLGKGFPPLPANRGDSEAIRYHELLTPAAGEFSPLAFAGHEMATGYDPLVNQRFKQFSGIDEAGRSNLITMLSERDRTLDLLNVGFVFLTRTANRDSQSRLMASSNRWVEIKTTDGGGTRVFENRNNLPRAWLCPRVLIATEDDQLRLIRGEGPDEFDPAIAALVAPRSLEKGINPSLLSPARPEAISADHVKITRRTPVEMVLTVDAPQMAVLVISELSSNGWKATIDGREVPLIRVDYILRGLELTAGSHEVRLFYRPTSLLIGTIVSLAGLIGVLLMFRSGRGKQPATMAS
jgi:hypothetical protein